MQRSQSVTHKICIKPVCGNEIINEQVYIPNNNRLIELFQFNHFEQCHKTYHEFIPLYHYKPNIYPFFLLIVKFKAMNKNCLNN